MCKVDDILVSIGKRVNLFSGLLDGIVNFLFRYYSDDNSSILSATTAEDFGKFFGKWSKAFFSAEVTAYQNDYNIVGLK